MHTESNQLITTSIVKRLWGAGPLAGGARFCSEEPGPLPPPYTGAGAVTILIVCTQTESFSVRWRLLFSPSSGISVKARDNNPETNLLMSSTVHEVLRLSTQNTAFFLILFAAAIAKPVLEDCRLQLRLDGAD